MRVSFALLLSLLCLLSLSQCLSASLLQRRANLIPLSVSVTTACAAPAVLTVLSRCHSSTCRMLRLLPLPDPPPPAL